MKCLNKKDLAERDRLQDLLDTAHEKATEAITAARDAVEEYAAAVAEANEWRQDIADRIEGFVADKSEKWQEGEKGEAYRTWLEPYECEFEVPEADFDTPEELDLSALPEECFL